MTNKVYIKDLRILLLFFCFSIISCSPKSAEFWIKEGYNDRGYSKIAVIGITQDLKERKAFEETAVSLLIDQGINAVEGIQYFPPNMSEEQLGFDNLMKIIRSNELDGIITMSLIDTKETERYNMGTTTTYPAGYYRVGKYLVRRYRTIRTPGYYDTTTSYLIESVLYDLKGDLYEGKETTVWIGQSSLVDPSSVNSAAKNYTRDVIKQMVKEGIIEAKN